MSLMVAGIMAGVSALASGLSNRASNDANEDANKFKEYNDLINIEKLSTENEIKKYNAVEGLGKLEGKQDATASAGNKRTSGAGHQNMQDIARGKTKDNFDRMDENLELSKLYGKVATDARKAGAGATKNASKLRLGAKTAGTAGLLFGGK